MGRVIRAYRRHPHHGGRGLTQGDIATWAGITQGQLSTMEKGPPTNRLDRLIFWAQFLGVPEQYLWFKLPPDERPAGQAVVATKPELRRESGVDGAGGGGVVLAALTGTDVGFGAVDVGGDIHIATVPGRFFPGVTIHARVYSATSDARVLVAASGGPVPTQTGRGLVVGVDERRGLSYGMDIRRAGQRLAKLPDGAALMVPAAYRLDDLTLGLIWAVANLDESLLSDDATLAAHLPRLASYESLQTSLVPRDTAGSLSPASQMWLGSDFCARHILRNADTFSGAPVFWTQERRGEDASAWLLFEHKINYLRTLADRYRGQRLARAFCVPSSGAVDCSRLERVLFLLAACLMESFDIEVVVCPEPEYAAVDGFVLDEKRQAIVASWVGVESLWHVDVTQSRPTVQEFVDANGYARAHSATAGSDPPSRLHALADYLQLDWGWFTRRCKDLADYGAAGLFEPRSRLLSTAGVDQACQFVAGLPR